VTTCILQEFKERSSAAAVSLFGESKQLRVETVCPYSVYPTNMVDKIVVWFSFEEEAITFVFPRPSKLLEGTRVVRH
jgi:hypothetical protein